MRSLATLFFGLVLYGCGGHAPPPSASAPPTGRRVSLVGAVVGVPANAIRRSAVQEALSAGPGAFLQRLTVDDHPVFLGGKFHGFRITALPGDAWAGIDLRPCDVVMRVNGFSIEHPEDAAEAFYSLRVASELRVEYERDGEPRELRFGIFDDGPPADAGTRRD
jgi:type II secretory pathway component PulC